MNNIYKLIASRNMKITGVVSMPVQGEYFITDTTNICRQGYDGVDALGSRILLEKIVDKQHPPEGHELVTLTHQEKYLRPKGLKYWRDCTHRWVLADDRNDFGQTLSENNIYCVPEDTVWEKKRICVTLALLVAEYEKTHGVSIVVEE